MKRKLLFMALSCLLCLGSLFAFTKPAAKPFSTLCNVDLPGGYGCLMPVSSYCPTQKHCADHCTEKPPKPPKPYGE